jgi:hypothetical protein
MQQSDVKKAIFAKIAEIEDLLLEASCEGEQLAELDCYSEVDGAVSTLLQQIDYYVD